MPDEKTLPIPVEIPWQLAATTQVLGPEKLGPDATTISLFTYVPKLDTLDRDYPDEQLVYLKFLVSIGPDFPSAEEVRDEALRLFANARPIWHVIFDVKITPNPFREGGIRPFFLAASPIRRTMIETGVVGNDMFEGESSGVVVGKSGSTLTETYNPTTQTSTGGWGVNLGVLKFGNQSTETTVSNGKRTLTQNVDTTNREASQERRELLSHMTNVNNVLTLLTAKHVGTPYLRFNLWPLPLRQLTLDPSDPNLWYADLLKRRSSGIEGIQEFYAIAAIPRGKGFCVHADLTSALTR
jgi:hypothetical protein